MIMKVLIVILIILMMMMIYCKFITILSALSTPRAECIENRNPFFANG
jgi:hypothetical protein